MELLKKAKCPNILQLYETFEDSENYYTVTKFMSVGNLTNYLLKQPKMPLPESLVKKIVYQVARGVQGMHALNIVHRDIKPSNIMLSDYSENAEVYIGDLGSAFKM